MKRLISIIGICLVLLTGCTSVNVDYSTRKDPSNIRILVATDTHYLAPSLTDHGEFFTNLITNSDGKVMFYSEELMNAFVDDVIAQNPEYLIVTGDLTFNGEKESHKELAKKFKKIEEAGIEVLVIPGNHDLYNLYSVNFKKDAYLTTANINTQEFLEIYQDFGYSQSHTKDINSLSYTYDLNDTMRVLMVDVNTQDNPNDISKETLEWIEAQLKQAHEEGVWTLAVSHQNIMQHSDAISKGYVIESNDGLIDLYTKYGVFVNFSGHIHMQHIKDTSKGKLTEIVTSSLAVTPNQYGVVDIANNTLNYTTETVDVSEWGKRNESDDANVLSFESYSRNFFWESSYLKGLSSLEGNADADSLSEYFADVNVEYFSGTNNFEANDDAFKSWLTLPTHFKDYFKSIQKEAGIDYTRKEIVFPD